MKKLSVIIFFIGLILSSACNKEFTCECTYDEQQIKEVIGQNAQGADSIVSYDTIFTPLTQEYTYKSNETLAKESCNQAEVQLNDQLNTSNVSCGLK
ncbi:MAG: hypothetical protein MRY83_21065 [Flavobacteriales bacterium]|nr:hypothetical protein [Flavobacteriales bacterium]